MTDSPEVAREIDFSLVDDPPLEVQRALHLAPPDGIGAVRRALFFIGITWVPIIVWAAARGLLGPDHWSESVQRLLGLHVRCLIAIPMLVLAEPLARQIVSTMIANFIPSGLVSPAEEGRYCDIVASVERLRDSKLVWAIIAVLATVAVIGGRQVIAEDPDAVLWIAGGTSLDFGAAWTLFVVRPLFLFLMLAWAWRLFLVWLLFRRISRLDLRLVPSHPDRVAGLGFLEHLPAAFGLVTAAITSVVCASIAHQILHHGRHLDQFRAPLIVIVVVFAVLTMAPLTAFSKRLRRLRWRARFQYGTLAGRHVRGLHTRWVEGGTVEDEAVLAAPEIGPAADVATLYDMATRMRPVPIGKITLSGALLPMVTPLLLLASLEISLVDMLIKVLGMLK